MTEQEAYGLLRHWAQEDNMAVEGVGGEGWEANLYRNVWVVVPPGRSDTVYCVTSEQVRSVHPSRESLEGVLEALTS